MKDGAISKLASAVATGPEFRVTGLIEKKETYS